MEKHQGPRYRSGLTGAAEAGLFCCISALLTFTRAAHKSPGVARGWEGERGCTPLLRSHLSVVDLVSSH